MGGENSKQWVLLAAGSKGWDNYRHQADVCHAYQMAHNNGIPDEQIVVMMYDDIAHHKENPTKGNIINEPNGRNVYKGVLKDYTGNDVSAENFLAILRGDKSAVRKSGPKKIIKRLIFSFAPSIRAVDSSKYRGNKDSIFIYLSDHGTPGMFSFPKSDLYAADLIDTVTEMARNDQFLKMVIYMESCHSGSMLNKLPRHVKVFGVSASTPDESSYACFFDEKRNAFLADVFTYHWLHHNKKSDLEKTTFQDQFTYLRNHVSSSTPCQYGNQDISRLFISEFLRNSPCDREARSAQAFNVTDAIPSHNVPMRIQANRIQRERDPREKEKLQRQYNELQKSRDHIGSVVKEIAHSCPGGGARALTERHCVTRVQELKVVAEHFRTSCFNWHEEEFVFARSHMQVFVNLCESGVEVTSITQAITRVSMSRPRAFQ